MTSLGVTPGKSRSTLDLCAALKAENDKWAPSVSLLEETSEWRRSLRWVGWAFSHATKVGIEGLSDEHNSFGKLKGEGSCR